MSFKCLHMSDIHWRGLTRHDEYRESFTHLFNKAREFKPDVIFIGGDIVHAKTQGISPELIDCLDWWFKSLADICPVHVILGNHDGLLMNKDRQDAITPIINAIGKNQTKYEIYVYKKSGTYPTGVPGFNWCVFSCFDEEGWKDVKPIPNEINIATFHGSVKGSISDSDWLMSDDIDVSFFKDFDFAFLGDIHKFQYLNSQKTIAYPGSTIQQNYGESLHKGCLLWEIKSKIDYSSEFYEIPHSKPFVTIDWSGNLEKILKNACKYDNGTRFRIRTLEPITQAEIKLLYERLKNLKCATEIVFKNDHTASVSTKNIDIQQAQIQDLRDVNTQLALMHDFYSDTKMTDIEKSNLDLLVQKYTKSASKSDTMRNVKWSLKKIEFDNVFAYGKDNVIDFDALNGVTGIFGKNRAGKSSIPGTIMYTLFNTTDRGPMSNLHIINTRKGHCRSRISLSANGKNYIVERQSTKKTNKAGDESVVTHVNLMHVDEKGNCLKDLNGEQRRDTDSLIRTIVGTSDDFLMTSLAAQGSMNNFIANKATQRKAILTKFLDLEVFDEMYTNAKNDAATIKSVLADIPHRDWTTLIQKCNISKENLINERDQIELKIVSLRNHLDELKLSLIVDNTHECVTQVDINKQEKVVEDISNKISVLNNQYADITAKIDACDTNINAIVALKEQFPIQDLRNRLIAQHDLEKTLVNLTHIYETEKKQLKVLQKSVDLLEDIPCDDKFPNCKFIKESHKNKKVLPSQIKLVDEKLEEVKIAKKSLAILLDENIPEKIAKYDKIMKKESDLLVARGSLRLELNNIVNKINDVNNTHDTAIRRLETMKLNVVTDGSDTKIIKIRREIDKITSELNTYDNERIRKSENIGLLDAEIVRLTTEYKRYSELLTQWKTYELFIDAVSHKGIPLKIMSTQLPMINYEIAQILQGVAGFTVELEAIPETNDMDIYINYGDSRRIIECTSGMEKMMASLAIRVALINISSLPKADIFIIDEGFGALDDMNIEACNRLLSSLRKWFRNILVISHVDAVKDAVDNVLDITQNNMDAKVVYEDF